MKATWKIPMTVKVDPRVDALLHRDAQIERRTASEKARTIIYDHYQEIGTLPRELRTDEVPPDQITVLAKHQKSPKL